MNGDVRRVDGEPATVSGRRHRTGRGYRVFQAVNGVVLTGVVIVTLYPMANVVARSMSDRQSIAAGEVNLLPRGFNLNVYRGVASNAGFWIAYRNTVVYALTATLISMVLTTTFAYVLSKKQLPGRGFLTVVAVVTMFFDGGIIPKYVLVSSLGLRNTIWAIVLPDAVNVFNLLVMKAFFESLPTDLEDAAAIDGLDTYRILLRIILPLAKPVVATVGLFYLVTHWNSWFNALLYLDQQRMFPVTLFLRNVAFEAPPNVEATACVVLALPIVMLYPLVQRYFVSGVLLGAIKE